MCLGGTSTPTPQQVQQPPARDDAAIRAAAAAEADRNRKKRGRQASILTGTAGDTSSADTKKKSLLGGS